MGVVTYRGQAELGGQRGTFRLKDWPVRKQKLPDRGNNLCVDSEDGKVPGAS